MAYTAIDDPSAHFHTQLWTGNASNPRNITNDANAGDFQPDIIWKKRRDDTNEPGLWDSQRAGTYAFYTHGSDNEIADNAMNAFQSNGWQINSNGMNTNNATYVAWQWKVNGGTSTGSGSESGNNPAYNHQANTTAGISIVTFTGTGSAGTVTHGLGATPAFIMVKNRTNDSRNWQVYHHQNTSAPETDVLQLNLTNATEDYAGSWNDTAPTSTVFTVGSGSSSNEDSANLIAYLWTPIKGYSHFGRYEGSGNADGPFVYTGFKPAFVLIKRIDGAENWAINDNKRTAYNPRAGYLSPDSTNAETSAAVQDFLSNGFKIRQTGAVFNTSGDTYIYAAFAESPFVTSGGVPCTAG